MQSGTPAYTAVSLSAAWAIWFTARAISTSARTADFFPDNPASGKVMEKCGFRDTGDINYCNRLQLGSDRPVKIMCLDNPRQT